MPLFVQINKFYDICLWSGLITVSIKGISKLKILLSFITFMLFQTCMSFFLMLNMKEHILKNDGRLIKQLMATIDFHGISFSTMEVDGTDNCLVLLFFLCWR